MEHRVMSELGDRNYNADKIIASPEKGIYIIADGSGNHARAKKASDLASKYAYQVLSSNNQHPVKNISDAMQEANRVREEVPGVRTTLDIMVVKDLSGYVGHIGDARIAVSRKGKYIPLTREHADELGFVQEAIGNDIISPDIFKTDLQENDIIAMMTDGVYRSIYSEDIKNIIAMETDLDQMLKKIKSKVNQNMQSEITDAQDNYSLILIRC